MQLDKQTLKVKHVVSSLVLLTNQNEINLAKLVASKGGTMVCNGAPHTRSWFQMAVSSPIPPNSENENSNAVPLASDTRSLAAIWHLRFVYIVLYSVI